MLHENRFAMFLVHLGNQTYSRHWTRYVWQRFGISTIASTEALWTLARETLVQSGSDTRKKEFRYKSPVHNKIRSPQHIRTPTPPIWGGVRPTADASIISRPHAPALHQSSPQFVAGWIAHEEPKISADTGCYGKPEWPQYGKAV